MAGFGCPPGSVPFAGKESYIHTYPNHYGVFGASRGSCLESVLEAWSTLASSLRIPPGRKIALDDALVAPADRLKIGNCNLTLKFRSDKKKEERKKEERTERKERNKEIKKEEKEIEERRRTVERAQEKRKRKSEKRKKERKIEKEERKREEERKKEIEEREERKERIRK
ncbi:hypothetical protein Tco_0175270 [Tanacetum coccineum]